MRGLAQRVGLATEEPGSSVGSRSGDGIMHIFDGQGFVFSSSR